MSDTEEPPPVPVVRPPPPTTAPPRTPSKLSSHSSSSPTTSSSTAVPPPPPPAPPLEFPPTNVNIVTDESDYYEDDEYEDDEHDDSPRIEKSPAAATYILHGHGIVPLRKRPVYRRKDVLPFAILYVAFFLFDLLGLIHSTISVLFPLVLCTHIGVFLAQRWKIHIRASVGFRKASLKNNKNWTHALVTPPSNCGATQIVPIYKNPNTKICWFHFQDVLFQSGEGVYDSNLWKGYRYAAEPKSISSHTFTRLHFPIDWPLSSYTRWKGHVSLSSYNSTARTYSINKCHILTPSLLSLLSDQLVAPFFLFQVFCVMLWSLDEYWYYAIFTLFTLVLFECTVALNRRKNLQRLRETLRPPYPVLCYRFEEWSWVRSEDLVAGDILSLTIADHHPSSKHKHKQQHHQQQQRQVPCDALLLAGSAVVNEAMLTGESVPQMKEAVERAISGGSGENDNSHSTATTRLDMEDLVHKKSIIFGGTTVVDAHPPVSAIAHLPLVNENPAMSMGDISSGSSCTIPPPPDGGCVAFVLRTGFETQQGHLLRTMIHSSLHSKNDGVNTKDTFYFISLLVLCALLSAIWVFLDGWYDETRNKFRVILHVIIILTSVVPPELPMELSLAVTSSLADLMHLNIFCTEPFRIPLAGKVDTCAFDKTGTLTSDEMRVKGLRLPPPLPKTTVGLMLSQEQKQIPCQDTSNKHGGNVDLVEPLEVTRDALRVMVGCQALAVEGNGGGIIGDPLEKAVLRSCEWTIRADSVTVHPEYSNTSKFARLKPIVILHRFAFESRLKRMTTLVKEGDEKNLLVLTKGAPEVIKQMLSKTTVPPNYDAVYRHHMSMGQRVLCLAYKDLGTNPPTIESLRTRGRRYLESSLIFAGFLVLDCPLKPDSARIMNELKASNHGTVMITGDSALTACEVARQVGIIDTAPRDTYDLRELTRVQQGKGKGKGTKAKMVAEQSFAFVPISAGVGDFQPDECIAFVPGNLKVLADMVKRNELSLCVTGDIISKVAVAAVERSYYLEMHEKYKKGTKIPPPPPIDPKTVLLDPAAQSVLKALVPCVSVFARHAPRQKEAVIAAFNEAGRYTLMCGDGTNDVGALKQAHVGISIISVPELEAKSRAAKEKIAKEKKAAKKERKSLNKHNNMNGGDHHSSNIEQSLRELAEAQEELNFVALGDASVASPFTSRTMSIACCKNIIQQGRCTLVTMLTIYKILGVNCLVNALVLSKLHMNGVKQGDRQLTGVGVVVAALFFFVTKGKPLASLSPNRPPSSVLCAQAIISIVAQFTIHLVAILIITNMSLAFLDPDDPSVIPDGPFNPNPLNTSCFLLTVLATINTFVVNYRGRPFMQSFKSNRMLLRSVQICVGALFVCALEIFEPLNQLLQLSPLPTGQPLNEVAQMNIVLNSVVSALGFKVSLLCIMVLDSAAALLVEKRIINYFEN